MSLFHTQTCTPSQALDLSPCCPPSSALLPTRLCHARLAVTQLPPPFLSLTTVYAPGPGSSPIKVTGFFLKREAVPKAEVGFLEGRAAASNCEGNVLYSTRLVAAAGPKSNRCSACILLLTILADAGRCSVSVGRREDGFPRWIQLGSILTASV